MPVRSSRRPPQDSVRHPLFARAYARFGALADERAGIRKVRQELLSGLSGRVIEIGAGNGLNFPHYPHAVSEVVAVEPERYLRRLAVETGARASVPVDVVPGVAEALPVKSEAFDGAVVCLVLCSVRDVRRALGELVRVLRPGAELRFFEHGRAEGRAMATAQRLLDRTVWPPLFGGCHTGRDMLAELEAAGFVLGSYRRLRVPEHGAAMPSSFCVLGSARRPPAGAERGGAEK